MQTLTDKMYPSVQDDVIGEGDVVPDQKEEQT